MDRDDALKRIRALADLAAERLQLELPELQAAKPKAPRSRKRVAERERADKWRRPRPEDLLEQFTPAEAFAFVHERTVPPANEDGAALLEAYPELSAAAPELVADMAVAFRTKQRHEYAAYFALVARHHGLDG